MREILLPLPGRDQSYRICLSPGLRLGLGQILAPLKLPPRLFVVSDRRVARLHGGPVLQALVRYGYAPDLLTFSPGERAKTWAVVQRLARELLARGPTGARPSSPWAAGWWGTSAAFWPPSSCGG